MRGRLSSIAKPRRAAEASEERDQFIAHIVDQLRRWAPVSVRRLFGGQGVYRGEQMFAFIRRDTLYLRTDEINRPDFEATGMGPLRVGKAENARIALSYHEAPAEILDEPERLAQWAERAYAAALRRDAAKAMRAETAARRNSRNRTRRPPLKRRKD